jgi:hypothetical protein
LTPQAAVPSPRMGALLAVIGLVLLLLGHFLLGLILIIIGVVLMAAGPGPYVGFRGRGGV